MSALRRDEGHIHPLAEVIDEQTMQARADSIIRHLLDAGAGGGVGHLLLLASFRYLSRTDSDGHEQDKGDQSRFHITNRGHSRSAPRQHCRDRHLDVMGEIPRGGAWRVDQIIRPVACTGDHGTDLLHGRARHTACGKCLFVEIKG